MDKQDNAKLNFTNYQKIIRIEATAIQDDRIQARQNMLDSFPMLKSMYAADDGNCEVLYLKDATATFSSFTTEPRIVRF